MYEQTNAKIQNAIFDVSDVCCNYEAIGAARLEAGGLGPLRKIPDSVCLLLCYHIITFMGPKAAAESLLRSKLS